MVSLSSTGLHATSFANGYAILRDGGLLKGPQVRPPSSQLTKFASEDHNETYFGIGGFPSYVSKSWSNVNKDIGPSPVREDPPDPDSAELDFVVNVLLQVIEVDDWAQHSED